MSIDSDPDRRLRYEATFRTVYEPLQRYVARRCTADAADDVVSEVLLVLWRRLDDVPADDALPWTYGVARRVLSNQRRGERRRLALVDRVERTTPRVASRDTATDTADDPDPDLVAALDGLGDEHREVLLLWAWEELAPREIATVLAITPNAASIRLHRAKARLADRLTGGKTDAGAGHEAVVRAEEAP